METATQVFAVCQRSMGSSRIHAGHIAHRESCNALREKAHTGRTREAVGGLVA
uniref:Uncharacterized protein n=1 Tax=Mycobacterium riyadhense TaxID=486698 RepID=A0A653ECQ1_9MYCO|nr:hypothetical protein BIN_B_00784 [Mycobacterium riyadhense]